MKIDDMLFEVIEEVNYTLSKPKLVNITHKEKIGIVYNTLRRKFIQLFNHKNLDVKDIICYFEDSKLINLQLNRSPSPYYWSDKDISRIETYKSLKEITEKLPFLYPTKILNQMALIINSIK